MISKKGGGITWAGREQDAKKEEVWGKINIEKGKKKIR